MNHPLRRKELVAGRWDTRGWIFITANLAGGLVMVPPYMYVAHHHSVCATIYETRSVLGAVFPVSHPASWIKDFQP